MLAFLRDWHGLPVDGERMVRSLGIHAPGQLRYRSLDQAIYASIPGSGGYPHSCFGRSSPQSVPAVLPCNDRVLFSGWFDNLDEVGIRLGISDRNPARVYGQAVERWGDAADSIVIGAYAAVIDRPRCGDVRFSRSPITAPPLHIHRSERFVAAACVPRALLALGIPCELDDERIAMHLAATPFDRPGGWYKGIEALQLGTILTVNRDGQHRTRPYDLTRIAPHFPKSDGECQEQVEALLGEAIDRTIANYSRPGTFITGGLDSTIVASHLADRMPVGQRLNGFHFCNDPDWFGEVAPHQIADERALVSAFAAHDGRIDVHYADNKGLGFEDGQDHLFLLTGICPTPIGLLYPYHAMFAEARAQGCDLLIGAGMGNSTFSNSGTRGFVEYLRKGKVTQAWRACSARPFDPRPVWRRFLSLSLLRALPLPLWRTAMRLGGRPARGFNPVAGALNPEWPGFADLERDARSADPAFEHGFYRSRDEEVRSMAVEMDADACDMMQGFQQKFGIAFRDVTRYRPLVEYCFSLPVDQYLRDGEQRRLAREMGRGRLPEAVRTEQRYGFQHADWHLRIGRRRERLLDELRQMDGDPEIAGLVDTRRFIGLLENYPANSSTATDIWYQYLLALPIAVATGRFVRFVKGTNA